MCSDDCDRQAIALPHNYLKGCVCVWGSVTSPVARNGITLNVNNGQLRWLWTANLEEEKKKYTPCSFPICLWSSSLKTNVWQSQDRSHECCHFDPVCDVTSTSAITVVVYRCCLVTFPSAISDTLKHNHSGSDDIAIDEVSKSPTIFVYKDTTSEMNLALTQD